MAGEANTPWRDRGGDAAEALGRENDVCDCGHVQQLEARLESLQRRCVEALQERDAAEDDRDNWRTAYERILKVLQAREGQGSGPGVDMEAVREAGYRATGTDWQRAYAMLCEYHRQVARGDGE